MRRKTGTIVLTMDEWAVICTIRQEPSYRFRFDERLLADQMVRKGLLKKAGKRRIVTAKGERVYAKH